MISVKPCRLVPDPEKIQRSVQKVGGKMAAFEMTVERLRPLVNDSAWEFCIFWTLGDDPSRFILWRGCCCCGGNYLDVKEEKGKEQLFVSKCRDSGIQHPVRTEACKELAQFPLFIPLYSGIHGEVIMSKQPRWIMSGNSFTSDKMIGTQVLVPVAGGLIELCSRKPVPRDDQIIDFIRTESNSDEQVSVARSFAGFVGEPLRHTFFHDSLNTMCGLNFTSRMNLIPNKSKSSCDTSYGGSSAISNPFSNLHLRSASGRVSCGASHEKQSETCPKDKTNLLKVKRKRDACFEFDSGDQAAIVDESEARGKRAKENCRSKNLITERKRRNKIKHLLYALRALVPNITKMHTAAILGDAADYIHELQTTVEKYEEELRQTAEERFSANDKAGPDLPNENQDRDDKFPEQLSDKQGCSGPGEKKQAEVEIEVNQIGAAKFLLRITCQKRQGAFFRLMEAIDVSGLQVLDANVTTYDASVLNIIRVEAKRKVHPETMKDALVKFICEEQRRQ